MTRTKGRRLSIVDEGFVLEGSICFRGELLVRGRVVGKLAGDHLTVASGGEVQADVRVARLTVAGHCEGDLRALEEMVILPGGCCRGRVFCGDLILQSGGRLDAEVTFLAAGEPGFEKRVSPLRPTVIDL